MLARTGVMTGFSATATRENAAMLASDAFIDQQIADGDLFGWFFLLQPIGRSPRPDLMVTPEQRLALRAAIQRWRATRRPIFLGDFWNDGPLVGGCLAGGRYYFHVYANGDLSPCVFAPVACENVMEIRRGASPYVSVTDVVQRHPLFVAFRESQAQIHDRARPCPLIDHPEAFRRISSAPGCRPAKNMPDGYLDGSIASILDSDAAEFRALVAKESSP
jgi:MoaA/NifB/PqqE/SkfB family radical SAM enzyme